MKQSSSNHTFISNFLLSNFSSTNSNCPFVVKAITTRSRLRLIKVETSPISKSIWECKCLSFFCNSKAIYSQLRSWSQTSMPVKRISHHQPCCLSNAMVIHSMEKLRQNDYIKDSIMYLIVLVDMIASMLYNMNTITKNHEMGNS